MQKIWQYVFKYVLPIMVVVAVGYYFYGILSKPVLWEQPISLRFEWLLPAALFYLLCHLLWGCYWTTLLRHVGIPARLLVGLKGYFVSQWGKYIPGKVWVILIRMEMLKGMGANRGVVAMTAFFETLTAMASGAFLGVLILPLLPGDPLKLQDRWFYFLPVAGLPVGLWLLNGWITQRSVKKQGPDAPPFPRIGFLVVLRGFFQTGIGWFLLGISLWMTIQGLQPETGPFTAEMLLRLVGINAIAYVLGFLALFMPAGGGIREIALQSLLVFELSTLYSAETVEGRAAIVSLVVRLIWTVAELIVALLLQRYIAIPSASTDPTPVQTETIG